MQSHCGHPQVVGVTHAHDATISYDNEKEKAEESDKTDGSKALRPRRRCHRAASLW
jgi:hypothetical protein